MKKQEKTQKTKERILVAALQEFGTKNYDTASINSICDKGNLPKGLIYHNFKSKDEIYLLCVKKSYYELLKSLKSQPIDTKDAKVALQHFLMIRQDFFIKNPLYANIFFNAVLQPPKHLSEELMEIRKEFDNYISQCYISILDCLSLREGITREMALEYFLIASEMFNGYFRKEVGKSGDYRNLIKDHEGKLSIIFDIMLYGIAKEPNKSKNDYI